MKINPRHAPVSASSSAYAVDESERNSDGRGGTFIAYLFVVMVTTAALWGWWTV